LELRRRRRRLHPEARPQRLRGNPTAPPVILSAAKDLAGGAPPNRRPERQRRTSRGGAPTAPDPSLTLRTTGKKTLRLRSKRRRLLKWKPKTVRLLGGGGTCKINAIVARRCLGWPAS